MSVLMSYLSLGRDLHSENRNDSHKLFSDVHTSAVVQVQHTHTHRVKKVTGIQCYSVDNGVKKAITKAAKVLRMW